MKTEKFRNDILPLKNMLFRLSLRIVQNREEAEDIVQDTMIKMWDKRSEWEQIDNLEAYACKICRNLSLDRIKGKEYQNSLLDIPVAAELQLTTSPQEIAIGQDGLRLVKEIIDRLPEKQRSCMQLRDIEGKTYKEIADMLSITEEQVKVNIFRARQTVKQRFKDIDNYGL